MKNRLISIVLLIVMFSSFSLLAFAETVMLDRSLSSFDEETAYKENDYFGTYGVRGTSLQGKGVISLHNDNGNKMIKMAIPESVTSGYNSAMLTLFANRNHKEYYKKGVIIDLDIIAPESGTIILHTRGASYYTFTFFKIENLKLIPATGRSTYETNTTKHATLEKGKMHNLKIVFDTSSKSYTIFLDGKQVGDKYTVQDAYLSWKANSEYFDATTGAMKEVPELYFRLMPNLEGTTTYPVEAYVDNLKITSYNLEGMEVASDFDIYDDEGKTVPVYDPSKSSHKIGMDVFNNTSEADEAALVSLKYKKNENGFNLLESYSVKRLPLLKGYNRADFNNMLIPDSDPSFVSKLIFLDSLYNPEIKAPIYTLANDGTDITVTKTDKPAAVLVDKGTIEAVNLDNEITVSGIALDSEGEPLLNVPVGLTVLNKDVTKDGLISEYNTLSAETNNLQSFVYTDLTQTDIEGKYTFKIEMPESAEMGDYLLIANVGGKEATTTLRYLTTAQKQASIKKINEALSKTSADLLNEIDNNEFPLSLFLGYTSTKDMYNGVKDKPTFFELVKSFGKYSEDFDKTGNSVIEFNKNLDNSILLSNLEGIDDLALLKQTAESIAEQTGLMLSGITSANSDAVYTALAAFTDFSSLDAINKCIAEAIVLYNIPNALSWGTIKTAIESYSELLGLDLSDSKVDYDKVYHKMYDLKSGYTDIGKIVASFNELKLSTPVVVTPPPVIRPVTGGGGGGGGVSSRPQISEEIKNEETKEENKEDIIKPETPVRVMNFNDVKESFWGYKYIKEAYEKGLVNGISEEEFNPDGKITREEFVAMLVRCVGLSDKNSDISFSDIKESDWYSDTVKTAYAYGIIKGREDGTFGAGESITRQDIAVMIKNMADNGLIPALSGEASEFKDADSVSDYALSSVKLVSAAGIFSGYEDLTFRPDNNAIRAEATAIILRIFNMAK